MPMSLKTSRQAGRFSVRLAYLIFLFALVVRLWALLRLTHSALLIPSRGDMHFYNDWARQILHGRLSQPLAFYGLPGYAYLLAVLYKLFGENPFVPGLLQAGVDAGTAALIYQISLRIFHLAGLPSLAGNTGPRLIGLFAGLGWAFFVPAQAYSVVLMPTAWFVFVFWFVVWRIAHRDTAPYTLECFLLGLLIGFTATGVAFRATST